MEYMSKKILNSILMFGIAIFLFVCSGHGMKNYECLVFHYPDEFVEVEIYEDPADNSPEPSVFDKGKAIYDRRYVYNNKIYRTEIAQDEFEEKFYVCKHKPSRAFSESDLETPSEDLVVVIILVFGGIALIITAIVTLIKGICDKVKN